MITTISHLLSSYWIINQQLTTLPRLLCWTDEGKGKKMARKDGVEGKKDMEQRKGK